MKMLTSISLDIRGIEIKHVRVLDNMVGHTLILRIITLKILTYLTLPRPLSLIRRNTKVKNSKLNCTFTLRKLFFFPFCFVIKIYLNIIYLWKNCVFLAHWSITLLVYVSQYTCWSVFTWLAYSSKDNPKI